MKAHPGGPLEQTQQVLHTCDGDATGICWDLCDVLVHFCKVHSNQQSSTNLPSLSGSSEHSLIWACTNQRPFATRSYLGGQNWWEIDGIFHDFLGSSCTSSLLLSTSIGISRPWLSQSPCKIQLPCPGPLVGPPQKKLHFSPPRKLLVLCGKLKDTFKVFKQRTLLTLGPLVEHLLQSRSPHNPGSNLRCWRHRLWC